MIIKMSPLTCSSIFESISLQRGFIIAKEHFRSSQMEINLEFMKVPFETPHITMNGKLGHFLSVLGTPW